MSCQSISIYIDYHRLLINLYQRWRKMGYHDDDDHYSRYVFLSIFLWLWSSYWYIIEWRIHNNNKQQQQQKNCQHHSFVTFILGNYVLLSSYQAYDSIIISVRLFIFFLNIDIHVVNHHATIRKNYKIILPFFIRWYYRLWNCHRHLFFHF